jgi:Tol biopolymer transport system component/DNA-binding winged helix-turn-helix (wHTH) protein
MKEAVGSSQSFVPPPVPGIIRFGNFELDPHAGELRRGGIRIKLSGQPFDVLLALLEKPGQVVTREELHEKLWSQDTFVDFEHGLNKAINKVRDALGDDADNPRFVETLPRRGYKFLAPVAQPAPAQIAPDPTSASVANAVQLPSPATPSFVQSRNKVTWLAAIAVIAIVLTFVVLQSMPPQAPRVLRYTQLTHDGLNKFDPPVTDGSRIYFGEQDSQQRSIIAQVSVSGGQVNALTTFPGSPVSAIDYSPARSELLTAFAIAGESPVWALSVPGASTPRRVGNIVVSDAAWSRDGQSVVYSKENELNIVKADGSESRRIATVQGVPGFPRLSPDGAAWRFTLLSSDAGRNNASLWEVAANGSNLHPLFPDWRFRNDYAGSWTPDGKYFIFGSSLLPNVGGSIFAIREKRGFLERRTPEPIQITAGPLRFSVPIVSRDGKQIFAAGFLDRGDLLRYNAKTHSWESYLSGISAADLDFSKDGEWVTYVLVTEGTLWRSRVDGSERLQLTISPMRAAMPRWSPDGKTIAFMGFNSKGVLTIYTVAAEGGEAEQLLTDNRVNQDPNWSPDGSRLVYGESAVEPKAIHILELKSRRNSVLPGSKGLFSPRWSPDGRFILALTAPNLPATRSQSQPRPTKLMSFDLATQKWKEVCEARFMAYPTFSRDGKYVYFSDSQGGFFRLELASGRVEKIAHLDPPLVMKVDDFWFWTGLTPDDSPMFLRDTSTREIYALDVDFP